MKKLIYVLIPTLALAVFGLSGTVLADVACPTDTPVPPVDTPMSPTETRVPDTSTPVATCSPQDCAPTKEPLPTYPPTPTEEKVVPTSDPTPTGALTTPPQPSPYPLATETAPYPAPQGHPKTKVTPTPSVLPETGFFDENPFAPLIALAVFCASVFGVVGFIRRKNGNS